MADRWRTKSIEQSIADTDDPDTQLRKDLSWWHLCVFGVSVVIGAGIFTVTASTAGDITGPAIWISFLIAATTCGLAALCYAEFASMLPVAGSAYTFSYATFGEFVAWTIGWNLVLELAIGGAVVAKGWSSYLQTVFGFASGTISLGPVKLDWGALLIVALVATLLALGTKLSSHFSMVVTAIKVAVVVLVIVVGAFYVKAANYSPFIPPPESDRSGSGIDQSLLSLFTGAHSSHYGWYGVLAGASIVFFAFIGFDIVATMAEETKNPQRDVPRGILVTLGVVTVLYVAVSVVLSGMVSYTQLKTTPDGHHANLATAFAVNGVHWASGTDFGRRARRLDHRGDGAAARRMPGAVRDGARRLAAATAGQDRCTWHPGPHHGAGRVAGRRHGLDFSDGQAGGNGQRRHPVRLPAGVSRRHRPAPYPPRAATRVPGTAGAAASGRFRRRLYLADGQPHRGDLGAIRNLDARGRRHLRRIRTPELGAGQARCRCSSWRLSSRLYKKHGLCLDKRRKAR